MTSNIKTQNIGVEIEEEKEKLQLLQRARDEVTGELADLENKKKRLEKVPAELEAAEKALEEKRKELTDGQELAKKLQTQVKETEGVVKKAAKEAEAFRKEALEFEKEVDEMKAEVGSLEEDIAEKQKISQEAQNQKEELEAESEVLIQQAREAAAGIVEELDSVVGELISKKVKREKLQADVTRLEASRAMAEKAEREANAKKEKAERDQAGAQEELSETQGRVTAFKENFEVWKKEETLKIQDQQGDLSRREEILEGKAQSLRKAKKTLEEYYNRPIKNLII